MRLEKHPWHAHKYLALAVHRLMTQQPESARLKCKHAQTPKLSYVYSFKRRKSKRHTVKSIKQHKHTEKTETTACCWTALKVTQEQLSPKKLENTNTPAQPKSRGRTRQENQQHDIKQSRKTATPSLSHTHAVQKLVPIFVLDSWGFLG